MILQAPMIAPQALFHAQRRPVGAVIGIRRACLRLQGDFRIEMDRAFGAEPGTFALDRHVAGLAAVEIFAQCFADARFADVEIFA
jgi:hypothetical protein